MVVIVGVNGSGKSTLLKLLVKLATPTSGEVTVNNVPLSDINPTRLCDSVAFLAQHDEVYPLSLYNNIILGSGHGHSEGAVPHVGESKLFKKAAKLGGAKLLLDHKRLESSTVLDPACISGWQSIRGCGNGEVSRSALDYQRKATANMSTPISISEGEKQRITA